MSATPFVPGGIITTIAGNDTDSDYSGDGGIAIFSGIGIPGAMVIDSFGNIYIGHSGYNGEYYTRILKIDSSGIITRFAGSISGYSGDGGLAINAQFSEIFNMSIDRLNNIYLYDGNNVIRKIDFLSGIVTSIAGTGEYGFSGDGGPATSAKLGSPGKIAVDSAGNVYIPDINNHRVRKIDYSTGIITTIAGVYLDGVASPYQRNFGDGGLAINAGLYAPTSLALDSSENLYISLGTIMNNDFLTAYVRKIDSSTGIITVFAGDGVVDNQYSRLWGYGDGGLATNARFYNASDIAIDSGNIYIIDNVVASGSIRMINSSNIITTIAGITAGGGNFLESRDGAVATNAKLRYATGKSIAIHSGKLYILDRYRLRMITPPIGINGNPFGVLPYGIVSTVAGTSTAGYSEDGVFARFSQVNPQGVAIDSSSNIYIADGSNYRVRKINSSGIISTVAGNGQNGYSGDGGLATNATLGTVTGVAVDSLSNLYITDTYNNLIRKVNSSGIITTIAGIGDISSNPPTSITSGNSATSGRLNISNTTGSVAIDSSGNVYVVERSLHRVSKINSSGILTVVAGTGVSGNGGEGVLATTARLNLPDSCVVDSSSNIYISDTGNNKIRKINSSGIIRTMAGAGTYVQPDVITTFNSPSLNGFYGKTGDGALAIYSFLNTPKQLAVDSGNLYINDSGNGKIRMIDSFGIIYTVAGTDNSNAPLLTDTTSSTTGRLSGAKGITVYSGKLYITETSKVRVVTAPPAGTVNATCGGSIGSTGGSGGSVQFAYINANPIANGLIFSNKDSNGNSYFIDGQRIRKFSADRVVTEVAGGYNLIGSTNATGAAARFNCPAGIAVDSSGNIYVSDSGNFVIRKIDTSFAVTTVAGTQGSAGLINADGTSAKFTSPQSMVIDSYNNLFIIDIGAGAGATNIIRKVAITPTYAVTTFATNSIGRVLAIALPDTLYTNGSITQINSSGQTTTFAATNGSPTSIGVTTSGNIYYLVYNSVSNVSTISILNPLGQPVANYTVSGQFANISVDPTTGDVLVYSIDTYTSSVIPLSSFTGVPCFLEGTQLLCYVDGTEKYLPIESLKPGVLVKTVSDGYKAIDMIGYSKIYNPGNEARSKNRLYKCSPTEYPELDRDLCITGCHCILVDTLTSDEEFMSMYHYKDILITGEKYRLAAHLDDRAKPWNSEGLYTIWHLALEHEDNTFNYGIYANGLLVETTSKRYLKEYSGMTLVDRI